MKKFQQIIFGVIALLFTVGTVFSQAPTISSFSPDTGSVGSLVTLSGTNLSNASTLTIGGSSALIVSNSATQMVAMVMPNTTSGAISVTTAGGNASASGNFTVIASQPPFNQQGPKLLGSGAIGGSYQGWATAISADGSTAIVGGPFDKGAPGAAWIFTRTGTTWTQQGIKIAGNDSTGDAYQGWSVALSANGNTALIGGPNDSNGKGAAWVFTRTGTTWTQQGPKLVGTGSTSGSQVYQGNSVSLSADGNTALIGGPYDNNFTGAMWVFKRNGNTWSQQGSKLTGSGAAGFPSFGYAVALSADGLTAIAGGFYDNSNIGAAWVFTSNGVTWTQQGSKLVGSGNVGSTGFQGYSVGISANGNTAIIGGPGDNSGFGAAWIFTRSGNSWSQQGQKLIGTGSVGSGGNQGNAVSISADGNTCLIGANYDDGNNGATWVFTRSGNTWTQFGNKLVGSGGVGGSQQGTSLCLSANGSNAIIGGFSDDGLKGASWIFVPASANANLSNLTITTGTLNPTFSSATIGYTSSVPNSSNTVTVTPTLADALSTIQVRVNNGAYSSVSNAVPSAPLSLNIGSNTIDVLVTAQNGFTTKMYTITVTRACPGFSAILSGSDSICPGASVNLVIAVTGGLSPFSVVYSGGTINNYISGTNIPVSPAITTNYNLTSVTDANNCLAVVSGSPSIVVKTIAGITSATATNNAICPGTTTTLTANGVTGTNAIVNWWSGTGGTGTNLGTGLTLNNIGAGTYYARVTADCGSPVESVVTVTNQPVPSIGNQSSANCSGAPFSIIPAGAPNGTTYSWGVPSYSGSVTGGNGENNENSIQGTLTNNGISAGTATYTVTPKLGSCAGSPFSAVITVYPLPVPTFTASPASNTCAGTNVTYTTESGMSDYIWSVPGVENTDYTIFSGSIGTGSHSVTLKWLTAGNKTVTVNYKNSNNCPGSTSASSTTAVGIGATPSVTISITAGTNPSCTNSSITFAAIPVNGGASPTYQWYKNNIAVPSGTGASYTVNSIGPGNLPSVYVVMTATSGSCVSTPTATSPAINITLVSNVWTGSFSNQWGDGRNWCSGVFPASSSDVSIPLTSRNPAISSNTEIRNINIDSGASVTLSNCTLKVNGTVTGKGVFSSVNTATLAFTANGNIGTLYFAPTGIGSLKFLGTAVNVSLGNPLSIYNELNIENATLNTNGLLTIKSTVSGTGWIAPIVSGSIIGNVTVERYIPQNGFRAWRLLSVPVQGSQTFKQAWQENQNPMANGLPGYGTLLTNSTGGNGYDAQTSGNSLLSYNSASNSYVAVPNTNTVMQTSSGYMVYIRGDRSAIITGSVINPTPTTLRTNGLLYVGTQPAINVPSGQNVLVGNVYAAPIDFDLLTRSGVNAFKVWDPKLYGSNNVGAFQTFSSINGYDPIPGGGSFGNLPNSRIESGQAFFVTSASGGSIQLKENAKSGGSRNVFKTNKNIQQFKTNLYIVHPAGNLLADGNAVVFDSHYSGGSDEGDVLKIKNIGENVCLKSNGNLLVIEGRSTILHTDTLHLEVSNLVQKEYAFEFVPQNMDAGLTGWLKDKFTGITTPISLNANTVVKFMVTEQAASRAGDRFMVVLKPRVALSNIVLKAEEKNGVVLLNWKVANEANTLRYEIEYAADGVHFEKIGTTNTSVISADQTYYFQHPNPGSGNNYYRIKQVALNNSFIFSEIVKVVVDHDGQSGYLVYPNPIVDGRFNIEFPKKSAGTYHVKLINHEGRNIWEKKIYCFGASDIQALILPSIIAAGTYQLEIISAGGNRSVQQVVIAKK